MTRDVAAWNVHNLDTRVESPAAPVVATSQGGLFETLESLAFDLFITGSPDRRIATILGPIAIGSGLNGMNGWRGAKRLCGLCRYCIVRGICNVFGGYCRKVMYQTEGLYELCLIRRR
jgi:hypothetical protein